jgi:hypothetical protein
MGNARNRDHKKPVDNDRILETERGRKLARLLPPSDNQSDEDRRRRAFLLEHEYRFDNEFSTQYQKIKKLHGIKPDSDGAGGVSDDDLRFGIGEIVYKYWRRYNPEDFYKRLLNPGYDVPKGLVVPDDYFKNLERCMHAAEGAVPLLDEVVLGLVKLDGDHLNQLLLLKERVAPNLAHVDAKSFLTHLQETSIFLGIIPGFAKLAIGDALPSGGQGHPKVRYVRPTAELLILWFKLTGRLPVTTTKKTGDEFVSPSSEFVRLCLTMIEPTISSANVATSITRAFDALDYMIEIAGDQPIQVDHAFWLMLELAAAAVSKEK